MEGERRYGRAVFLTTVAGGVTSLVWGKPLWDRISGAVSPVAGRVVPILPTQGWRIYTVADTMPSFDRATWRLTVGGDVDRPLTLDYDRLRALPRAEQTSDFHCVTGWSVDGVRWAGVRLRDLFAEAKPGPRAHGVEF